MIYWPPLTYADDWKFPEGYGRPIGWVLPKFDPKRRMTAAEAEAFNRHGLLRDSRALTTPIAEQSEAA